MVTMRVCTKNQNRVYTILDLEAYNRFWIGRKPSTRTIFEEWLFVPTATMNAVALKHGKIPPLLGKLVRELRKESIMEVKRLG